MEFFQTPPRLGNQYDDDRVLRSHLERTLPAPLLAEIEPTLREVGALSGGPLYERLLAEYRDEPTLVPWGAWGRRVDEIRLTPLWQTVSRVAAEKGLIAAGYEKQWGAHGRTYQHALAYLLEPSTGVYSCPLAMTDGAAKTLLASGNRALIDRAVPRLTSRDPDAFWTSGQWMTERTGGSDVGISQTVARPAEGGQFRLYGTKWFTSATTSPMALTLARPEGGRAGGGGLALFYLETRDAEGNLNGIRINRLKDKLGTRMVPTAELTLEGALATPVAGLESGVKNITPMLTVTRLWNAVGSVTAMRRGLALARDYARRRVAFGAPLAEKPLHVDTLAGLQAEFEGAFLFAFRAVELLGREEAGRATEHEKALLRLVTPIVKLTTAKQAVAVVSEVLEAFGGAGYVEDTGLPRLLRDAQVMPIWEGTTNVLSLDVLRAMAHGASLEAVVAEVRERSRGAEGSPLEGPARRAVAAVEHAVAWLERASGRGDRGAVEAGARRFALTLGRSLELALLVDHARWALGRGDRRPAAAAHRLARHGVDLVVDEAHEDEALLCDDT
ncbi:MAG TPA: acyl-CoA dehydrogenase family protein [Polyangiaceae bacterium]|nr:acyl-CoA dehydrogenase family protein [Polyangiaceae bacterium]